MMTNLPKAILATIIYYDLFGLPLTLEEVKAFLINPKRFNRPVSLGEVKLADVLTALQDWQSLGAIEEYHGFYFLPGRTNLFLERIEKNKIAEEKWKKARRYIKIVQALPYIEAVFASGSLALGHTGETSDLDILVITKPGRIWLGRLLLLMVFQWWGVRRTKEQVVAPDKVCPNHYLTLNSLSIPFPSLYNAQTYVHLVPLYLRQAETADKFSRENQWVKKFVGGWSGVQILPARLVSSRVWLSAIGRCSEWLLEVTALGRLANQLAKKIQLPRLNLNLPGRIVANDQQLEFHPFSAEKNILERYHQALEKTGRFGAYHEFDSGLK